jgi:hypothetical protein
MDLTKLEKYKRQYKQFESKIDSLEKLLAKYTEGGMVHTFSLDQATQQLNVPATVAIFLLSLAEKENFLDKKFHVKSTDSDFDLGSFKAAEDIPKKIFSEAEGKLLSRDDYYVEIVFELK